MALMTEDGKPIQVQKKTVDKALLKQVVAMQPQEEIEVTEPNNVLTKMMVEGRADKLLSLLQTLFNSYIERDNYGNVSGSKTKTFVMTLMLEEKKAK